MGSTLSATAEILSSRRPLEHRLAVAVRRAHHRRLVSRVGIAQYVGANIVDAEEKRDERIELRVDEARRPRHYLRRTFRSVDGIGAQGGRDEGRLRRRLALALQSEFRTCLGAPVASRREEQRPMKKERALA